MKICEYENMWMLVKCGKLQKHVENSPKNVENVWKSAWKMWITALKMWETLWIKCGNVENMWETHLYVQMCKIVANYTNVSQFFLFFCFFCFFVIFLLYFYNLSKIMTTIAGRGGALQLYALARRHGTWEKNVQWVVVYRGNENGGDYIFKIRYICIYKCLIFLSVREFSLGLSVVI